MEPALADSDEVNCLEPSKCQEKENNASVSPDDEKKAFHKQLMSELVTMLYYGPVKMLSRGENWYHSHDGLLFNDCLTLVCNGEVQGENAPLQSTEISDAAQPF